MNIVITDLSAPSIRCADEYCALTGELDLTDQVAPGDFGAEVKTALRRELAELFVYEAPGAVLSAVAA